MSLAGPRTRRPLMAANWKMNKSIGETEEFLKKFVAGFPSSVPMDVVICAPFLALASTQKILTGTPVQWGAQNLNENDKGAFTGEVSPVMLKDVGCAYVIVGHSERRQYFGESDEGVNKKIKAALKHGMVPIVCVGETLKEREANQQIGVVHGQVQGAFKDIPSADLQKLVIAYEPVWAIGTGKTASPAQAQEMHLAIRDFLKDQYGSFNSLKVRILYGGSMKPENTSELMSCEDVDGGLVGGASLDAESFLKMVNFEKMGSKAGT